MKPERMFELVMELKEIFDEMKEEKVEVYFYDDHIEFCRDEFVLEYYFVEEE